MFQRRHRLGRQEASAERGSGEIHRPPQDDTRATRRKACRVTGTSFGSLADLPHNADRPSGSLGDPLPLQAHSRFAALRFRARLPREASYPFAAGVASACGVGEGCDGSSWSDEVNENPARPTASSRSSEASPSKGECVHHKFRHRLTYANVMSTLAVFIALGGSSYAALTISGSSIKNRSVPAKKLKRNSITGKEVRESRLYVARARRADRLGGFTADQLRVRCPSDTFPIAGVRRGDGTPAGDIQRRSCGMR